MDDHGSASSYFMFREPVREDSSPAFGANSALEGPLIFGRGANAVRRGLDAALSKKGRERERTRSLNPGSIALSAAARQQLLKQQPGKPAGVFAGQQREEEAAKARRLQRFGVAEEARSRGGKQVTSIENEHGPVSKAFVAPAGTGIIFGSGHKSSPGGNLKRAEVSPVRRTESAVEDLIEVDGPDNLSAEAILGMCPDMCPGAERDERERKGDLDRFERVEGDRNQTSKELAVKKYTRTAERDAVLIRPLSVLKMTMTHLLSLLVREHQDDLLAVHNFLWDRMRAVRMDMRMQHIFNEDAITMHEQMIRFHIVAMHELCEYSQGERISDVFNAHLNIEQMNKTSVDLFQMYEDHRKKGTPVASEAEFRGYYALLKLDKHPGYRVEPAELSRDLAKMSPGIRKTPQILFAREVARACRASNYVAFFRLARDATYLQACLMHAHFSKLRTEALASLHSGLQKNQGIPISTVVDWLGMEGEDIEPLIKYYGFPIKMFEEPYMVKEGAFVNKDVDFPTSRSEFVEAKRSFRILLDVITEGQPQLPLQSSSKVRRSPSRARSESMGRRESMVFTMESSADKVVGLATEPIATVFPVFVEEEMPDYEEEEVQTEMVAELPKAIEEVPVIATSPVPRIEQQEKQGKKRRKAELHFEAEEQEQRRLRLEASEAAARRAVTLAAVTAEVKRLEEERARAVHKAEAEAGKQWRWLRKWRRKAATKGVERRQKQRRAEAALNTLSLGIPLRKIKVRRESSMTQGNRSVYFRAIVEERGKKLQNMWARIDILKVIGKILQNLNPATSFLCWKLLLATSFSAAGKWVCSKLKNIEKPNPGEKGLVGIARGTVIAEGTKLLQGYQNQTVGGFWFTAIDVGYTDPSSELKVTCQGASGILFVLNESEPIVSECERLHALVHTLPEFANIPLLILSAKRGVKEKDNKTKLVNKVIERQLELDKVDKSRISAYCVTSIVEFSVTDVEGKGFYSDSLFREGLVWLASNSPLQPQLRPVKLGELVREHLDAHFKILLTIPASELLPEQCILVFNKALDMAAAEVGKTASSSVPYWPPSEFANTRQQLEQAGEKLTVPGQSWNETETLKLIFAALNSCQLPAFPVKGKWSSSVENISAQKAQLETLLLQYLSLIEGIVSESPATVWEVRRMVQVGCTLKWSEAGRVLIPKWASIFRSIFSSRLQLLESMSPLVYVARMTRTPVLELFEFEKLFKSSERTLSTLDVPAEQEPLLDELIGDEYGNTYVTKSFISNVTEHTQAKIASMDKMLQSPPSAEVKNYFRNSLQKAFGYSWSTSTTLTSRASPLDNGGDMQHGEISGMHHEHLALWPLRIDAADRERQSYELPLTESELELERMVEEFQTVGKLQDGVLIGSAKPVMFLTTEFRSYKMEERNCVHYSRDGWQEHNAMDEVPAWSTNSAFTELNDLVEKCKQIDDSISKSLQQTGYWG